MAKPKLTKARYLPDLRVEIWTGFRFDWTWMVKREVHGFMVKLGPLGVRVKVGR